MKHLNKLRLENTMHKHNREMRRVKNLYKKKTTNKFSFFVLSALRNECFMEWHRERDELVSE